MNKLLARGMVIILAFGLMSAASAMTVEWAFVSGTDKFSSATDGSFSATITADGSQDFAYSVLGDGFLISRRGNSGDTLTLSFSEPVSALSFDIGSLDEGNDESVVFSIIPSLTPVSSSDVDWPIGNAAVVNGTRVVWSMGSANSGRVSFDGLPGLTSFTFAEEFAAHAIYYDNFSATIVPVPAGLWLFSPCVLGLVGASRLRNSGHNT